MSSESGKAWPGRRFAVGNDVVDTSARRCQGKASDPRFLGRVCGPVERARIASSTDPHRALWRTWAAKEAAFKVVSKLRGSPPTFNHVLFRVLEKAPGLGTVEFGEVRIPWRDETPRGAGYVHVVAWSPGGRPELDTGVVPEPSSDPPLDGMSEREQRAVYSGASAWVRLEARARAAQLLAVAEADLEIVCGDGPPGRTLPLLLLRGRPAPWDVSLSHHGRFVAWALGRDGQGRKLKRREVPKRE